MEMMVITSVAHWVADVVHTGPVSSSDGSIADVGASLEAGVGLGEVSKPSRLSSRMLD